MSQQPPDSPVVEICRLCLCRTPLHFSLLGEKNTEMLRSLASIEVTREDTITTEACLKCLLNLRLAYRIQQGMQQADEQLRILPLVKVEVPEADIAEDKQSCEDQNEKESSSDFEEVEPKAESDDWPEGSDSDGSPKDPYKCELCDKSFESKKARRSHKFSHKRQSCPVCNKDLGANKLNMHIQNLHSGLQQKCVCELCGRFFKNTNSLRAHKKFGHGDRDFRCDKCDKTYAKLQNLNIHIASTHSDKDPDVICELCGMKFYTSRHLGQHVRKKHNAKSLFCPVCNKAFCEQYALNTHMRQHTKETPFRCEVCGAGFVQRVSLRTHLRSKHNIEEKKEVPCKVCTKAFATTLALNVHMRQHFK